MMNYRTLKKSIIEMKAGEKVYINSIGLSLNAINTLRTLICDGIITPDIEEVKKTNNLRRIKKWLKLMKEQR